MSGTILTQTRPLTCAPSRAARELGLRRREFDLAVHLGRIRTVPDEGGGGRRVPRTEVDRLLSRADTLRESVKAVGTAESAALMGIPAARFTRFARLGLITPVTWYPNRYRAVVWLYLAEELRQFTADERNSRLLTGRTPEELRELLRTGVDRRARNWRGRHRGFLLRQAGGPWARAGAVAAFLDPGEIDHLLTDPHERVHVRTLRPAPPAHGAPGSPAAQLAEELMTADEPDEIDWLRSELTQAVAAARTAAPAPHPEPRTPRPAPQTSGPAPRTSEPSPNTSGTAPRTPGPAPRPPHPVVRPRTSRGLRDWLYKALKSPSWTTETSSRPSRS
ncbi:DUF6397 family protein [Streptomyces humi]|uniref:DUF6397 family protein n=1 Tax=Streptomyces humi TaxID=1428620 RepID=UPI0006288927|nr:DUF6397 family protein [Streptomyces humi]